MPTNIINALTHTSLGIIVIADFGYVLLRSRNGFPKYGPIGRVLESVLISIPATWWLVSSLSTYDPRGAGIRAAIAVGLIVVPLCFAISKITGRSLYPPIAAGWLASLPGFFVVAIVMLVLSILPWITLTWTSSIFTALYGLTIAGGAYLALEAIDVDRDNGVNRFERERISLPEDNAANKAWSSNSANASANDSVVEESTTIGGPTHTTNHYHGQWHDTASEYDLSSRMYGWERSITTFDDIGGYSDVKNGLSDEVVDPLVSARTGDDRFSRFGIEPERGVLLYGPPGTGKTMFARALAGELDVPFVELSPADITSMWVNESSDHVKTLFDEASDLGECIIFLDEAEHLFGAREHTAKSAHAEDRKVTSEFLAQLTREDRRAIVVAATNRPGDIDRAILRPGRLTAHFEVGIPDEEARHAILSVNLKGVPSSLSGDEYAEIATHSEGLTGADLVSLVAQARRRAAQRDARAVTREDFPSNADLKELAANLTPKTDDLPDVDAEESGSESDLEGERRPSPETAARGEADDDPALGY
ncbi:ATP-binding protein [Haloglomus halophilum]|uniref:ATP-binding protein n=1 Tax=Haloglomus halophilum TaxID=2962672 RepID=UPI0020C9453A|nr:ATP-binding protein [Haloglomus halophilum]